MTPSKRTATPPEDTRPNKKQAISSPEEGEVDSDVTPPAASQRSPRTPPPPATKVPFPFKPKVSAPPPPPSSIRDSAQKSRVPAVYERSEEDERRIREAEELERRLTKPRAIPTGRPDHWEPGYDRTRDRWSRDAYAPPAGSYYRPRKEDWDYGRRDDYDWDRQERRWDDDKVDRKHTDYKPDRKVGGSASRSTPSTSSQKRSPSPVSPPHSPKEKHRLPRPRTPVRDPSPVPVEEPGRRWSSRHYEPERSYPLEGSSYYPREYDRDLRGHYRRTPPADFDYHRRDRGYDYRDYDDRWGYDDRYDDHRDAYRGEVRRGYDSYRPVSPTLPPGPVSPRLPRGPITPPLQKGSSSAPPPPPSPPPPPPPGEPSVSEALPAEHVAVSISLPIKRPGAPKEDRSPPSILEGGRVPAPVPDPSPQKEPATERRVVPLKPKRTPVHRTREQEKIAYGRTFVGCGSQADYDVLTKLGEGTFGEVHKAIHTGTGRSVALKRILMHNEKEGMPVTALREIKILKALNHPCIVEILDMFVVRSKGKESPLSVYMVFPYMDHDLAGLLENERVKLQPSQIKLYMKQLLEGTEYMHRNQILHRDMKAANLLISNTGSLRIADFGLARSYDPNIVRGGDHKLDRYGRERKYTNCVVTRWYRPPELLLGARQYGGEVDIWGIGCVLGEMFWRRPILAGSSDIDQLDKIWQLCGSPNQQNWPNWDRLPGCEGVKRFPQYTRRVKAIYETIGPETCDLLDKLLTLNPRERISASEALDHDYFWSDPLPADPKSLPTYEASHEFDKRGRRNQGPAGPPLPLPQMQQMEQAARMAAGLMPPHARNFPQGPLPPRETFRNGPPPGAFPQQQYQGGPPMYPPGPGGYFPGPHGPYPPPNMRYGGPPAGHVPPPMAPHGMRQHFPPHPPHRPPFMNGRGGGPPMPGPQQRHGSNRPPGPGVGAGGLNYG
ncbi:Pkinase-domain-containing protein [Gloeophyllum trabeum ATCC 11539]|uniref:Pkinase-domain-containing protein n=1 Tax=Gloeophyllum trabeum (strain ATCC 11539 / FP-39264 / Madison 617) TaxID=670483 RepID=S7RLU2_GLOTA|nr:Pkinase-domain-containing protein [Gloeophyllum trabeum ATCC 11539]EPQ53669.1 Pkinase-domain-containing protein [Gloeophyllum trabeum ATCC 11539]